MNFNTLWRHVEIGDPVFRYNQEFLVTFKEVERFNGRIVLLRNLGGDEETIEIMDTKEDREWLEHVTK